MIHEQKFGLVYHTFVYEGQRSIWLMREQEAARLKFLCGKFMEELAAGEKIFVYKRDAAVSEEEILPLYMALNRYGDNTLLWVMPAERDRPAGTVEVVRAWSAKGLHRSVRARRQRPRFFLRRMAADLRQRVRAESACTSVAGADTGVSRDRLRPSVLLYDWDNTLVDGWAGITAALNAAFAASDKPLWTVEDTRNRVRVSLRESFPVMFGDAWERARDIFYRRLTRPSSAPRHAHAGAPRRCCAPAIAWPRAWFRTRPANICAPRSRISAGRRISVR